MNRYLLLSLMIIPSTFTSFTSVPSIHLSHMKPQLRFYRDPLIVMNAMNKNKSKIVKVEFNNIDDELREFDDKLLKINIIYYGYLICLYLYIISFFDFKQ